jgi:Uma2 family endonuclease
MLPQEKIKYTLEEYLELDHESEEKIEFWDGHIFTLAGASSIHDRIQSNAHFYLRLKLQGKSCRVFLSDMRLKVPEYPPYRYPDLSALCGEAIFEKLGRQELLVNPALIVEVLSDSTEAFDRSYKFTYYKSIPSFTEYILIAQDRPHVSQFVKQADNSWLNHEFNSLEESFHLASLGCDVALTELFEEIAFPEKPNRYGFDSIAENE